VVPLVQEHFLPQGITGKLAATHEKEGARGIFPQTKQKVQ
jgi:hypothetical protein